MTAVKFLLKMLFGLLVLGLILGICLIGLAIWSVPKLGPKGIDSWIEGKTGFSAAVNSIELKVFSGYLGIEGMALINPPYYQNKNLMQIKRVAIQIQASSLYKDRAVLDYVFIDIDRISCVKNGQGSINIKEFFDKLTAKGRSSSSSGNSENKQTNVAGGYIIKKLIVKVGGVDMIGFLSEKDVQNFSLNYSKEFTDVTDLEPVVRQVIVDFAAHGVLNLVGGVVGLPLDPKIVEEKVSREVQRGVKKAFRFLQKVVK